MKAERCTGRRRRRTSVVWNPREKKVVKRGWKLDTTRSDAKGVAVRAKKRGVREQTAEIDAVGPYWVEMSLAREGIRLRELTLRRV